MYLPSHVAAVLRTSPAQLQAETRASSFSEMAAGARKIAMRVPNGHLMGGTQNPAYTSAMSDGNPAPKLVIGPDQKMYLGYNDAESGARVAVLNADFSIARELVKISGKRVEDFLVDSDGIALLLTEFDSERKQNYIDRKFHTAHIEKYNLSGRVVFRTRIVGTREYKKEGDQGIDTYFGNFNIASDGDDTYATYFSTYRRWDDGVTHQSEYLALFDADDGKQRMREGGRGPEGFTWNVSHSFRPRFVHDGERYVMATVGDAYPRGFVVQSFPNRGRELPVPVPKAAAGETYQYVPVSTGDLYARNKTTYIAFDSAVGRSDYDIGLVISGEDGAISKPIYITNTPRSRERIPRVAPYGDDRLLVLWMTDTGAAKDKWFPNMQSMALEGAIIDNAGRVISQPSAFGTKGQFQLRAAARMFQLPGGQVGWVNDVTGLADQLEIVLIPGPDGDVADVTDPEEQPAPVEEVDENTDNETVKIDPSLNEPLLMAIYNGEDTEALALLKRGADPNAKYEQWTALLYAAYFGRTNVALELIRRKADPNASVSGWSALRLAESRGHTTIASALKPITDVASRAFGREAVPSTPGKSVVRTRGARIDLQNGNAATNASTRAKLREIGGGKPSQDE